MATSGEPNLVCLKCDCKLSYANTNLNYMGYSVSEKFLRCPKCKQVYIPEDVVVGKMAEVEASLEDK